MKDRLTAFVKETARLLGFAMCGVAAPRRLDEEADRLQAWLEMGYAGGMDYMRNHFDKRVDPESLVPRTKSIVCLAYNYYPEKNLSAEGEYKIARYAYGEDYHDVIREKLRRFLSLLQEQDKNIAGRGFVDSAPVMEREWAQRAGLGWVGKNTLLISRDIGSYFFLAELMINVELNYDAPIREYCGTCTACLDACPTQAFVAPYVLDASKCISYHTIESKENIPAEMSDKFNQWIFGCDICQEICPWNKWATPHDEPRFRPSDALAQLKKDDWENLKAEEYDELFERSPLQRAGFQKIKDTIAAVKGNSPQ